MKIYKPMSFEEYSTTKHKTPYVYSLKSKDRVLYYFGEHHSHNPQDSQWSKAKEFWSDFIKNTNGQKRIVFIESQVKLLKENEEETIRESGGPGFASFLAKEYNINTYCPEPKRTQEMNSLFKKFSKEEIAYHYFARSVSGWYRMSEPKPKFEDYIIRYLERDKTASGWTDFDFSLENMKKIHIKLFGNEFNQNNINFFRSIATPVNSETIINRIARECSNLRNAYIISEIQKYWNMGNSIYIQYGASHAVMQELTLRNLVQN